MTARLLAKARQEWAQRQFDAAERSIAAALALAPEDAEATRMLGTAVQRRGDHAKAAECFKRVLATWPADPALRIGLGIALFEQGETDEAITHLRYACELAPASAQAWFNLGEALQRQACTTKAIAPLRRAIELDPAHLSARLSLAKAQASLGQVDAAVAGFRDVLRCAPFNAEAWHGLSLNASHFDAADVTCLQRACARTDVPANDRDLLSFALAKALESRGDYAQAFDLFRRVNESRRTRMKWDAAGERRHVDAIRRAFAGDMPSPLNTGLGREVIFIVSMPRSGSTLVEHILASHPQIEGANEIKDLRQVIEAETRRHGTAFPQWVPLATAGDWQRLGHDYLARTSRWRQTKPRFTDKNLLNWRLVGAALAMLPAARVIVVRRDPVETCLACYRQCFTEEIGFASDLDEAADYCIDFLCLTRFWLDHHPGRVIDLPYESLVAEPEPAIRRLLDFCDLPFDSACLDFHRTKRAVLTPSAAQVRQPLRRDTARSAHYSDKLDRLRQRLREAGISAA
ncbi:sulfotransferase family protein [Rhodanobacter sp. DHB23]|uniref:tetratricopeptide repeat-containing sulfotransferase family protein n=1 Tax=Rhodanobacter sp. DHB23 TaxID=2775923 RepID=UPI00177F55BB|nr:sulfotransferase family protein [Rhodanobacter sp. DHB23]MBD8872975.1 sulfotransferase [Rhodanobacter sp. DHB23]